MKEVLFTITENRPLAPQVYALRLCGDTSAITAPGQFLELQLPGFFLRRPLSVCDWDDAGVTILYKVVGKGTDWLAQCRPGQTLGALTGLGNGFDVAACGETTLLIGGGIGVPPMYGLARRLLAAGKTPIAILGFNTAQEWFYEEEFRALGVQTVVTTVDGSYGVRGFVTDALPEVYDTFCACGPLPMLRALCRAADKPGFLSLEARMGCGFGACMGCTIETLNGPKRVCREGPVTTNVTLCGRELENPIIPASGTFGYGYEFAELYDINCLGTFSFKGTTLHPRTGNAQPRIAEAPGGMLNAVGLQNPGVDAVIAEELPKLQRVFRKPVMANVSGFSIEEYVEVCRRLDVCGQVGWLEVNISCPNVHGGGMSFGTDPKAAAAVTRAVKDAVQKPVIVKLSPNVTSIADIAKACEDAGADAVSLINTVLGMRIDLRGKKPLLANKTGGMSGPAIFPLAVRMVWQVYEAVRIPIIGMGGVRTAEDVLELMLAGATAVEVGAANLVDPFACRDLVNDLPRVMEQYHIQNLNDIIGGAHHG